MIWLPEALADVKRLHEFLKEKGSATATRAAQTILEGAQLLESAPEVGRPMGDDTGRRELFVRFGAGTYVLRYKLENQGSVVVLRVWHSVETRS